MTTSATTSDSACIQDDAITEREKYIRRVFETALFFRDMYEEESGGHTKAIELLKPIKSAKNTAVRKYVLTERYKERKLTLTDAAVELAAWQPDGSEPLPFSIDVIESELRDRCLEHERELRLGRIEKEEKMQRSFLRAARYIQRIRNEGAPAHSRVVEFFIPDEFIPHGGKRGAGHREHVVPCVYLLNESLRLFCTGADLEQVADFLRRYLVIVEITKAQQQRLDGRKLGLKNTMPSWWKFDSDCIFQRLHCAEIEFDLPDGFTPCTCTCSH